MSSEEDSGDTVMSSALKREHGVSSAGTGSLSLERLSSHQKEITSTMWKKMVEFVKITIFGHTNELEKFVMETEPNDCSLVARFTEVSDLDLSRQRDISVDSISLSSLHIPHPLVSFMRGEGKQVTNGSIGDVIAHAPIIVIIHGLGGQMSQFEPLMGLLSQCSEILSLDLPGFGNSKKLFEGTGKTLTQFTEEERKRISGSVGNMQWNDFTTENMVNIIVEFINQKIPPKKNIVLVGHSMGTHLSVKVAKKLPERKVEGLILLSPPGFEDDMKEDAEFNSHQASKTISMLKIFTFIPWLFNAFRVWDRLEGLESRSVIRQLTKSCSNSTSLFNQLRQLRWNMDINSEIVLKYVNGFSNAKLSDFVTSIAKFNDNKSDRTIYQKTLIICGNEDQVTPIRLSRHIHSRLTEVFNKQVSCLIEVNNAGHSFLLSKPEFVSGMVLNHIEQNFPERLHLSPAWVLKVKAEISGDKWGLKNEMKWRETKSISDNIVNSSSKEIAPFLGLKTLREDDRDHSPSLVESMFYSSSSTTELRGKLIAIIDISADIPPYRPKTFVKVKYYKCATVSKVVPDQVAIRKFIQLVDDILSSTEEEEPLIGVHCHYGFNRTGFLICCYLIEKLGWSVSNALDAFKKAKAPGIKHPHFVDALFVRYETP